MQTISVVAAIIVQEGRVLATQRGYGEFKGMWEFPGGKVEEGESKEQALRRELLEELSVTVKLLRPFASVEYDYPHFHLSLECFLCSLEEEKFSLNEHEAALWLEADSLSSVSWLPADLSIIAKLKDYLTQGHV